MPQNTLGRLFFFLGGAPAGRYAFIHVCTCVFTPCSAVHVPNFHAGMYDCRQATYSLQVRSRRFPAGNGRLFFRSAMYVCK